MAWCISINFVKLKDNLQAFQVEYESILTGFLYIKHDRKLVKSYLKPDSGKCNWTDAT